MYAPFNTQQNTGMADLWPLSMGPEYKVLVLSLQPVEDISGLMF